MKTLFSNLTAVTMDDRRRTLRHAWVTVEEGKISAVSTQKPEGTFDRVIDGAGKVLMPP